MKLRHSINVWLSTWLLFLLMTPASAAPRQVMRGHVPAVVARLQPTGRLSGTNRLNLAIGLPLRNREALTNLLRQIYDPASTNYHHYLTPEQFTEMFGPTEVDYQKVIDFARQNRLTVVGTHSNRTLVDVRGKVTDIERAFHVQMRTYQHPSEARQFYAPDVEPTLDASLPILSICGLNNYVLARPLYRENSFPGKSFDHFTTGSSPSGSYWGYDFRNAYAPGVTLSGAGQSVALFECDGYHNSDVSSYLTASGLPSVALTNVLIDGFSGQPSGSGGEIEVALDIDMAISMAPGLSKIIVYEGPNDTPAYNLDILNRIATDNLARQISSSWLIDDTAQFAQIYQQFAVQGQSFFQASGDEGAYYPGIFQYEDSPLVTLVGGTTLTSTGTGGVWASETVWSGSGGGISSTYNIPSWQTNINMATNQGSTTMRNIPDVALIANNIYIWGDGSPITDIGGTSCAAPLWAGFMALVNQQLAANGRSPIGFINPTIYSLAQNAAYTNLFHDIITGNNTSSSSPTKYYAVAGYDLCTGWGTPAGQNLINALAPPVMVTLPPSATEGDGLLAGAGQIQLPTVQTSGVVIGLTSSDPAQVTVPANVTMFAGQSNAVFDLTILDDGVLDGTQTATITASVPGFGTGSASMIIFDKETATLQLSLPATVTKGQGAVQGTVQVSAPVAANVTVGLSSSSTNLIQVPASVIIPSGQTSAVFTAMVLTDGKINGGQTVNLTAHEQNWTDGTAAVAVQDNVNLTVTLPASAWENAGVLINAGSVGISGPLSSDLTVSLVSGNPAKLTVPSSVTIPAGQVSNTFNITLVDNSIADGHQIVTVTASAAGFTNGSASMWVLDDESPPFPSNPQPGNLATNVSASTNLMWNNGNYSTNELILNGGFEAGSLTNWTVVPSTYGQFVINNGTVDPPGPDGPLPPFAGSYSALGEESGPGAFYMYQTISIPTNAISATLSWAHRVRNFYTSFSSSQQFQVRICDTNNNVLATPFTTNPGDPLLGNWVQTNYDLTSFAGKKVRVMFWVDSGSYYLDVHVDSVSVQVNALSVTNSSGIVTNDVYFGTNPTPGPPQFQGSTTNSSWPLPLLSPLTTYYWQIVAHRVGSATGAVWQFTTAGVDHFVWNTIASPQYMSQPFGVTVTAQDVFNRTVINFNGAVFLQATAGGGNSTIEDFESGIWPHSPWVSVSGSTLGTISTSYAHDGNYGLSDPEWIYRTDASIGSIGNSLSWWVRSSSSSSGRAYLGFGASASGCWSIVAAPNTSQLMIQQNSSYGFTTVASASQTWQANKWYKLAVQFVSTSSVTCNLYDSDGTTLLNSLSYANVTGLPGGVAMRSFGGFSLDTITSGAGTTIPMSPTNSGNFINGTWSGNVTVLQPAINVVLGADDGSKHTGSSNPFNILLTNDISVSMVDSPDPVSVGANLTYMLTVANTGPLDATGVMVTNILSPSVTFISATSSQGTCAQNGGVVACNLGVVPGATNATITIVVVPTIAGITLTNTATVSRAEADNYLGNNTATAVTTVTTPAISIADASVIEGNVGTTNMVFAVTLAAPSAQTITVNYATSDGTATAGSDYIATNGTVTFAPGITSATLAVAVIGDTVIEPDETFFVNLSGPVNGTLGRSQGVGTIINDDGFPGQVDHFTWSTIPSPQYSNVVFNVTLTVLDAFSNVVTGFNGTANLSGSSGGGGSTIQITPAVSGNFTNGVWSGNLTVLNRVTNAVLTADDGNGHLGLSNPFDVVPANMAPVILAQPTNQAVFVGGAATFTVAADGTPPLSCQWNFIGTNIVGATNATLTLTNVQLAQAGNYAVLVTNLFGSVLSSNAVLTVNLPPPVPVITGFSPISGLAGISVTIFGTNFSPAAASNTVYFGAVQAIVTAASMTNLVVTVPVGATYAPITETVNGLVAYANAAFQPTFFGDGSGITVNSFAPRLDLASGNGPNKVVIADLDGDGKPDLIVANDYNNTISLYRNISTNGSLTAGSFAPRVDLVTPPGSYTPFGLAVADVDGDGKLDIIVSDYSDNLVSVYRNTCTPGNISSNSFATRVDFATGAGPQGIAVADIDGDGKPDLLVANTGDGTVSILRNTGVMGSLTTNSFAPKVDIATDSGCDSVAVGDLDGDGKPDVVTANTGSGTVSLLRNISTPGSITTNSFAATVNIPVLSGPIQVAIGDLDGDGKPDLIVTFYLPQTVSVLRNTSTVGSLTTNSFAPRIDFSLGGRGHTPAIADLDGDGKPDVAVVTELDSLLSIFRNVSTSGSFTNSSLASRVDFSTGYNAWGVAIGDLDGDGRPDIVFCNTYDNTISIYRNIVPFGAAPVITSQPTNETVAVGGTASFTVVAGGTLPLSYEWNFNGTNISGATNSTLTLTNVQSTQAGNYTVLVTNRLGSILSSNAVLTVTLDHFAWNPIPSPRFVNAPFSVIIQAQDLTNGLFTNFTGTAILSSTNGIVVTPPVSGNFVQGVWTGAVVISQTASNLVLQADDGLGHFGLANPINVVSLPKLGMLHSGNIALYMWPVGYSGFVLETSGNLSPATWVVVPYSPIQMGDQYLLPLDMTGTNGFYRLWFPGP